MSIIANAILGVAQTIAETRGSGLEIRIKEDDTVEYKYRSKKSDDSRVWENHYRNVAFYFGDAVNPVYFDVDFERAKSSTFVDIIDNVKATKYYETVMQNNALAKMQNVSGPKTDLIVKLLYATLAGIGIVAMILLAIYGG